MDLRILSQYLAPIAPLLIDPTVNEVRVNPDCRVMIERLGANYDPGITVDPDHVAFAVGCIAGEIDQELNARHPVLDARLDDGSRVAILIPPAVLGGAAITIRRFPHKFTLDELVVVGTLQQWQAKYLKAQITAGKNIVVSGGTKSGKTTLARALVNVIPKDQRLVLIEQPAELDPHTEGREVLQLEARGAFTQREAVRATLRHSPDRIIIGEVRGGEAFDLIDALNTGHAGSITTVHANNPGAALERLVTLVARGDVPMPYEAIVHSVATAIHIVVQLGRNGSARILTGIHEVEGVSVNRQSIVSQEVQRWEEPQLQ